MRTLFDGLSIHSSLALSINHYRFLLVEITLWDNSIKGLKLIKAFYMNELFLNYSLIELFQPIGTDNDLCLELKSYFHVLHYDLELQN